ncbi:unnamed protein product [Gemmata massiliana]|uniref:Uncharacterized protein n=1 Tax=Gemmata massiliana TaxID=1210884 RepID=A0A6P2CYE5_9BACT|nr:hypothetical protein [Gemmata massiliana]VTR93913.1 unnamed protein product [Gemmata massiliana]
MPRFDGLLDRVISPVPLLAGVVVGFAACAWGGHTVGRTNIFRNFERFTAETDYRSNYQVGANQVRAIMHETARPDQIVVVVGGNSVFLGSGQGPDGVWTRALQAALGDRYKVINLALPGLDPQEFGTVAAEMMYRDGHHRMIVLTNMWLAPTSPLGEPDGRPTTQWFFWDAYYRDRLLESPERVTRLALPLDQRADAGAPGAKDQNRRDEMERQARLDRWLNYRDLWNGFEYEYAVSVWCKPLAKTWYRARKTYPDPDPTCPPAAMALLERLQPQVMPHTQAIINSLRPVLRRPSGEVIPPHELGGTFPAESGLRNDFPAPMRERLIVVASRLHPHFINLLSPDERLTHDAMGPAMSAIYERAGVSVVEVGRGYGADDYYDHVHLTVAGGRRMAAELAPIVRRKAAQLGYLEEAQP